MKFFLSWPFTISILKPFASLYETTFHLRTSLIENLNAYLQHFSTCIVMVLALWITHFFTPSDNTAGDRYEVTFGLVSARLAECIHAFVCVCTEMPVILRRMQDAWKINGLSGSWVRQFQACWQNICILEWVYIFSFISVFGCLMYKC
jgi:hypothetical protein